MQRHLSRLAKVALLASCAAIPLAGLGCEKPQAATDRKVSQKVSEANLLMATHGSGDATALTRLQEAAKETDASPAAKISANAMLGQAEYNRVLAARPKLDQLQSQATGLIRDIGRLAVVIDTNNTAATALAGREPTQSIASFQKNLATFTAQAAAADMRIGQARTAIDGVKARIAELETQRAAAAAQSSSLMEKSEQAKGQEAVDLFNKSMDARAQATALGYQAGGEQLKLARLEKTLEEATTQKKLGDEAIKLTGAQIQKLTESGQSSQKAIEGRVTASKAVFEGGSITAKAKELGETLTAADAQVDEIVAMLGSSANHWQQAAVAAAELTRQTTESMNRPSANESPSYAAWIRLRDAYSPFTYNLGRGRSLLAAGDIWMNQVRLLGDLSDLQKQLAGTLAAAKLGVPSDLASPAKLEAARTAAKNQLTEAEESLALAAGDRAGEAQRSEAAMMRVVVQYDLYALLGAKANLDGARESLTQFVSLNANAVIPPLPTELEAKILTRPGAPSARPMPRPVAPKPAPVTPADGATPAVPEGAEPTAPDGAKPAAPEGAEPTAPDGAKPAASEGASPTNSDGPATPPVETPPVAPPAPAE